MKHLSMFNDIRDESWDIVWDVFDTVPFLLLFEEILVPVDAQISAQIIVPLIDTLDDSRPIKK